MEGFVPKVPKPAVVLQEPEGIERLKEKLGTKKEEEESLVNWIASSIKSTRHSFPKMAKVIGIQLAIVLAINLIFWQIDTWRLPGTLSKIVMTVVFLTATYNNVIPKTIYWVIVFTFGKRFFRRIMREGFGKAIEPMTRIVPEFNKKRAELETRAYSILLIGGGIGLIVANNFASYSRFSGARNKMDKYFVAIVISFAVSYILGEGSKSGIVKFMTLLIQDVSKLLKRSKPKQLETKTFMVLSGFVIGLLLDAPLILMGLMYGGYILGAVALVAGIGLNFISMPASKA
ncbi:MAG: hypothetical protein SCL54_14270 [Bacillota bacterium]|nr:hypothetical protein [Bacillota bacterium]